MATLNNDELIKAVEAIFIQIKQKGMLPEQSAQKKNELIMHVTNTIQAIGGMDEKELHNQMFNKIAHALVLSSIADLTTPLAQNKLNNPNLKIDLSFLFKNLLQLKPTEIKDELKNLLQIVNQLNPKALKLDEVKLERSLNNEEKIDLIAENLATNMLMGLADNKNELTMLTLNDLLTEALRNVNDGVDPRVAGGVRFAPQHLEGNYSAMIDAGPEVSPFATIDDGGRLDLQQGDYRGVEATVLQHMASIGAAPEANSPLLALVNTINSLLPPEEPSYAFKTPSPFNNPLDTHLTRK
jgi:hypothetical protein